MNGAQLHLLVNHVGILASVFSLPLLLISLWTRFTPDVRQGLRIAALLLMIIAGPFALTAMLSGEQAEEVVEGLPVVSEGDIHAHEEMAESATYVTLALSLAALYLLILFFMGRTAPLWAWIVTTLLLLVSIGLITTTGHLGGKIRHPEITQGWEAPAEQPTGEMDYDDD